MHYDDVFKSRIGHGMGLSQNHNFIFIATYTGDPGTHAQLDSYGSALWKGVCIYEQAVWTKMLPLLRGTHKYLVWSCTPPVQVTMEL